MILFADSMLLSSVFNALLSSSAMQCLRDFSWRVQLVFGSLYGLVVYAIMTFDSFWYSAMIGWIWSVCHYPYYVITLSVFLRHPRETTTYSKRMQRFRVAIKTESKTIFVKSFFKYDSASLHLLAKSGGFAGGPVFIEFLINHFLE